jgi:hypothetical protein
MRAASSPLGARRAGPLHAVVVTELTSPDRVLLLVSHRFSISGD